MTKTWLIATAMALMPLLVPYADAGELPAYRLVADLKSDGGRIADVRIERRLEEAELSAIASDLADREPRSYVRTTVNFLLPATRAGDPPWATTTLVRELRTAIAGLRPDEERHLIAESAIDVRQRIGAWLLSRPDAAGLLTLFSRDGRTYFEQRLRGRALYEAEVVEVRASDERRFDILESAKGDHVVIRSDGELELHVDGRLMAVAERLGEASSPLAARTVRPSRHDVGKWPPEVIAVPTLAGVDAVRPPLPVAGAIDLGGKRLPGGSPIADAADEEKAAPTPRTRPAPARTASEATAGRLDPYRFFFERNN